MYVWAYIKITRKVGTVASVDAERQISDHAMSSKVGATFFPTGGFRFNWHDLAISEGCGARRQSRKDDDVLASVCSASVLGSSCTGDSDVSSVIFLQVVVVDIPVYYSVYSIIILSLFASYYSQIILGIISAGLVVNHKIFIIKYYSHAMRFKTSDLLHWFYNYNNSFLS